MSLKNLVVQIDREIARLQEARDLLAEAVYLYALRRRPLASRTRRPRTLANREAAPFHRAPKGKFQLSKESAPAIGGLSDAAGRRRSDDAAADPDAKRGDRVLAEDGKEDTHRHEGHADRDQG